MALVYGGVDADRARILLHRLRVHKLLHLQLLHFIAHVFLVHQVVLIPADNASVAV